MDDRFLTADSYEIELALDDVGNSTGWCANGLNNRQKVLCCTPPQKLNPFLPVPLENLVSK